MAHCRLALLVLSTFIVFFCLVPWTPAVASDDLTFASHDLPPDTRKERDQVGTGATIRHGMTRAGAGASVAALGSAVSGACSRSLRISTPRISQRWYNGSTRSGSSSSSSSSSSTGCGGGGGSSSSGGIRGGGTESGGRRWNNRSAAGVGGAAQRALSLLAPAVAPRAGTSAFFVVSPRPAARDRLAVPPPAGRARCRPLVRSAPLRFDISKPSKTELFLSPAASRYAAGSGLPSSTADTGSSSTSEMRCGVGNGDGGGGGGMTSSFTWLESVNSTMDEVKTLIVNQEGSAAKRVFAVAAREQLRGRGTKGRAWIGLPGNVFLTVAIPLDKVPVPLSLIPLRVGTLIAPEIQRLLNAQHAREQPPAPLESSSSPPPSSTKAGPAGVDPPRVSLKWPNDLLLGGSKVAGVLIEAELPFLLVGIGVNVRHKPEVPQQGPDRGRPAACLSDFGADGSDEAVRELSAVLTEKLCSWASGTDTAAEALAEWSRWVDWDLPLEIRDEGRAVTPVGVAPDGRLRVVDPATGKEELLVTEYLL